MFCWSLFVLLYFIFWPLCCLSFFFWPLCCMSFFFWPLCCMSFFFWPLCCMSFFFWPLCCMSFFFWPLCCMSFFFWPLCCMSFFFWPLSCLYFFDLRNLITPLVSSSSASSFSVAGFVVGPTTPKPFSCYACVDLPSGETCNTTTVCPAGHVRIISIWLLIWFTILQSSLCRSYAFCFV